MSKVSHRTKIFFKKKINKKLYPQKFIAPHHSCDGEPNISSPTTKLSKKEINKPHLFFVQFQSMNRVHVGA